MVESLSSYRSVPQLEFRQPWHAMEHIEKKVGFLQAEFSIKLLRCTVHLSGCLRVAQGRGENLYVAS